MSASDLLNLDIVALIQKAQALRDDPDTAYGEGSFAEIRLALVGGFTTDFVARILEVFLQAWRIKAEIFQTPFGTLTESILAPDSELYAFKPPTDVAARAPERPAGGACSVVAAR